MSLNNGCEMVKNPGLNMVDVEDTLAARHLVAESMSAKLECLHFPCLPSGVRTRLSVREAGVE